MEHTDSLSTFIQFPIPTGISREEAIYAAMTCVGTTAVLRLSDKGPAATIKNYVVHDGAVIFGVDIIDPVLFDNWDNTEDPSFHSEYLFLDPISCNWGLIN